MGNPQKTKGDTYERDLAKYFNEHIYKEERCSRAPLSGGGRIGIGVRCLFEGYGSHEGRHIT